LFARDRRANAFRVRREGKPLHSFPDHAACALHSITTYAIILLVRLTNRYVV